MNFKIGQKVTIKSANEILNIKNQGVYGFVSRMERYCGLSFNIESIDNIDENYVILDIKNCGCFKYKWHYNWLNKEFLTDEDFLI